MNRSKESKIKSVIDDLMKGISGIYMKMAVDMGELSTTELKQQFAKLGYEYNKKRENAVSSVLSKYAKDLDKGGTMCVERTVNNLGNGKVSIGSERKFVPWLKDFKKDVTKDVLDIIKSDAKEGVHPSLTRDKLKPIFEGTKHRALTASRTEAQKIRSDIRSQRFVEQGVKYVQWITARDGRVRPDHEARDGLIYEHENAPMMGEYNCRCVLAPADRIVENGAYVQPSPSIMMPESVLDNEYYALPPRIDIDTKEVVEELPKNIPVNPFSENGVSDKAVSSYKDVLPEEVTYFVENYVFRNYANLGEELFNYNKIDKYKDRLDEDTFSRLKSGEKLTSSELKEGFMKKYQQNLNDSLKELDTNISHISKEELLKKSNNGDIISEVSKKWGSSSLKPASKGNLEFGSSLFDEVYEIDGINSMDKTYLINNLISADKFVNDMKYPFPLSEIGSYPTEYGAVACFSPAKNSIYFLNSCNDYSKISHDIIESVNKGFHPKYTTADDTLTHELGHAYIYSIAFKEGNGSPYFVKDNAERLCKLLINNSVDVILSHKLPKISKIFTEQDQLKLDNYVSKITKRYNELDKKGIYNLTDEEQNFMNKYTRSSEKWDDYPLESRIIVDYFLGGYSLKLLEEAVAEAISREYTNTPGAPPNILSRLVVGFLKTYIMLKGELLHTNIIRFSIDEIDGV